MTKHAANSFVFIFLWFVPVWPVILQKMKIWLLLFFNLIGLTSPDLTNTSATESVSIWLHEHLSACPCVCVCLCVLECVPSSLLMSALSGLSALFLPHTSWAAGERERGGGEGLWHAYAHIVDFMCVSVRVETLSSVNDQLFKIFKYAINSVAKGHS